MALIARGLGHAYGAGRSWETPALAEVDLALAPGELVLVLGRTGSGKSTLLRLLAGLLEPTAGEVRLDGDVLVTPAADSARGRVGLVFQDPETQLFAESVLEDVAFGPRNLGAGQDEARDSARRALAEVGLDPDRFGGRSPFSLSGGEARRAAVAGVLAMRPAYLLLDEPTAGLDAAGREAIVAAVRAATAEAGVLAVTHDPEDLLPHAARVVVLDAGRIAWEGAVAALLADPAPAEAAGARLPEVARTMRLAAEYAEVGPATLDPRLAAAALLGARGASR